MIKNINDSTRVQHYFNLMVSVATYFGAGKKQAEVELSQVLAFEKQLALVSDSSVNWQA